MVKTSRRLWSLCSLAMLCALAGCDLWGRSDTEVYSPRTATAYEQPQPLPEVVQQLAARARQLAEGEPAPTLQDAPLPYVVPPARVALLPMDTDAPVRSAATSFPFRDGATRPTDVRQGLSLLPPADPEPEPPSPPAAVEPATQPAEPAEPPPPTPPTVDDLIRLFQARLAETPNDLDLQLRLRMLYVVAGRDESALAPIAGLGDDEARTVSSLLRAMMALRDRSTAQSDPTQAAQALQALQGLRERLMAHADLQIPALKLCRSVDGYGVYKPFEQTDGTYIFPAGRSQPMIVYCELRNHTARRDEQGRYRTRLNMQLAVYDAQGRQVVFETDRNIQDVSANRREDFFLTRILFLPPSLAPGEYTLKITLEDVDANKVASETAPLRIALPS